MRRTRRRVFGALLAAIPVLGLVTATPAFAAAPTIASVTPTSGTIYAPVTITGSGFTTPATVRFNGVTAPGTVVASATRITTKVPLTASTGRVSVTTAGGTATSTATFTVTPGARLNATTGPPTSTVTAYFAGLGAFEAVDVYLDTTDVALASADGSGVGNATVSIPAATTPGAHWITVVGRHSGYSAQASYTVRADWPQYGRDRRHTDSNQYENVLGTGNVANLREVWRTPTSSGVAYGSPAVVGGVAYVTTDTGTINAYDENTGVRKWTRPTSTTFVSSPAVVGGVLYIGGQDGKVYALSAATGIVKWTRTTGAVVQSSPTVVGGIAYVGSFDDNLYALNTATGAVVWQYTTGSAVASSPAVVGGVVYIGGVDAHVYALDAATGVLKWSVATINSVWDTPNVTNGRVYVGDSSGSLYSLRASTGQQQWVAATGGTIQGIPAAVGGSVYVGSGDGKVYAFDSSTGALRWSTTVSSSGLIQDTSVENGVVYSGNVARTYALTTYGSLIYTLDAGSDQGGVVVVNGALTINDFSDGLIHYTLRGDTPAPAARPRPSALRPDLTLRAGN